MMPNQLTISELGMKLAKREVSSREAVQACLDQIRRFDGGIRAFLSYNAEDALKKADAADRAIAAGEKLQKPFLGGPVSIKDVIAGKSQPPNCRPKNLAHFLFAYAAE